ncbi:tetraacyldisaccharide 4'-kinase [Rhodobacter calidifons]|uniref:Tetraacyldisaccharide 4'-kinase n=1 Tax=Rhodobacter calidifons TaxID=2715277 RepID=A0ABX0GAS5_9RHOB|nr:tetraacyldisaccharide 4'-kinase [Rhodobacter calidifons]NHB78079.1 tetraacyldisaccharide 4'-kinase [Rhodobacter calidifons]
MRAPGFWWAPPDRLGLLPRLLAPLGWLYAAGTARRLRRPGYQPRVPVICVGNLTAGGAGKTPTVIALVERLSARGHAVQVVSRGYGGRLKGPVRVDPARHGAAEVGDEPLLLSAFAPVWVARDRAEGVRAAEAAGAGVILLDDGFQNPAVRPALALVVVDAARGFGNGRCIPAGPLREPVSVGLARADLVLTIGEDSAQARFDGLWGADLHLPRLRGALRPLAMGMDWAGERVLAFAGIADPSRFFATLRAEGAELIRGEALCDHETLSDTLLRRLEAEAKAAGAQLVTTEKDAARLPAAWRSRVLTLVVRLHVADWSALDARLTALGL